MNAPFPYIGSKSIRTIVVLFFFVSSAFAGENRWSSHGPPGATFTDLAVQPRDQIVYASTYGGGIYRSNDGGEQWTAINAGITDLRIGALTIDPINPSILYAGSSGGAILKSHDGGSSWDRAGGDFGGLSIRELIIDPLRPGTLYAATYDGVFTTTDGAGTWAMVSSGLPESDVYCLAIAASSPNRLMAGTRIGLFVTNDRGEHWNQVESTIATISLRVTISAIAIDPSNSDRTYFDSNGDIFATTDGGRTWNRTRIGHSVSGFLIDRMRPSVVYAATDAGVYKTEDSGRTWFPLPSLASTIVALGGDPQTALYAADSNAGVFRSIDGGTTWSLETSGFNSGFTRSVGLNSADPSVIYAGTNSGIFKSIDSGREWISVNSSVRNADAVTNDPTNRQTVYAVGYNAAEKSTDGGETWTKINPNPRFRSGATDLVVDPSNPSTLYAVLVDEALSKSTDGGMSWRFINTGLPYDGFYGSSAYSLAIDPTTPSRLFAGSEGVVRSIDGGARWEQMNEGLLGEEGHVATPYALAIDPVMPDIVYAAGYSGLFRTTDGAAHWMRAQKGISTNHFSDVLVDPSEPSTVYVATYDQGIFRSTDRGQTWNEFNAGLAIPLVYSLSIDSSGKFLVAGTAGGVFSYEVVSVLPAELRPTRLPDDPTRLKGLLDQLRKAPPDSRPQGVSGDTPAFLIAAAGNLAGANGTFFRSEVTLVNRNSKPQDVMVAWLAAGTDGTNAPAFRITLPSSAITISDFVGRLGLSGLGSLLFIAIDEENDVDTASSINGFSRISTAGPSGRGSVSQSFPARHVETLGGQATASAIGLRQDPDFRTNVGIVNLDTTSQTFSVSLTGERRSSTLSITVEALSMRQVPIPRGDYGSVMVVFQAASTEFLWTAYASSVDNVTGDGWVVEAVPVPNPGN